MFANRRQRQAISTAIAAFACFLTSPVLGQSSAPGPCDTSGHRQFDCWVGDWDVYRTDKDQLVAHSKIEKLYGGCAIRENWMPFTGPSGGSLNSFRVKSGDWVQVWTDASNALNEYRGRWNGRLIDFEGVSRDASDSVTRVRMTYEPKADGSVVQTGYNWDDKSGGWALSYQFAYRSPKPR
jgi:hypothetical protein